MKANVPVFSKANYLFVIFQLLVVFLLCYLFSLADFGFSTAILFGAVSYALFARILRKAFAKWHRKGLRYALKMQYADAIPCFEASVDYFSKRPLLDKYRFITLLSASRSSQKVMGLLNLGFCYSQLGEGDKAVAYYEQALQEEPGNGAAVAALNMLRSVRRESALS